MSSVNVQLTNSGPKGVYRTSSSPGHCQTFPFPSPSCFNIAKRFPVTFPALIAVHSSIISSGLLSKQKVRWLFWVGCMGYNQGLEMDFSVPGTIELNDYSRNSNQSIQSIRIRGSTVGEYNSSATSRRIFDSDMRRFRANVRAVETNARVFINGTSTPTC